MKAGKASYTSGPLSLMARSVPCIPAAPEDCTDIGQLVYWGEEVQGHSWVGMGWILAAKAHDRSFLVLLALFLGV